MAKPAYPLGPRFAGPRQGLARGGPHPFDPPWRRVLMAESPHRHRHRHRPRIAGRTRRLAGQGCTAVGVSLSAMLRQAMARTRTRTAPAAAVERERTRKVARIGNQLAVTRLSTAAIRVLGGLARASVFCGSAGGGASASYPRRRL